MTTPDPARLMSRHAESAPGKPGYRVEALAKGLRILSLFTDQQPIWRMADIVTASGIPMPTVYRVVMTLAAEGYLVHLPDRAYRPGVRVLTLGSASLHSLDLLELATPRLQELAARIGQIVNLCVLRGDRVLYLVRLRNSDLVTVNIQVGSTLPAVRTSTGKLLLSYLDEAELRVRITSGSFGRGYGPDVEKSKDELLRELHTIRAQGWAIQDEELAFGLRSIAAPVRDASGLVVAGVNIAVPAREWSAQRIVRELRPQVARTASGISELLGYPGGDQ